MSTSTSATSSLFTRTAVSALKRLYPPELADSSFDNTGLLLESPENPDRPKKNEVLLTIDLTEKVADEAIERGSCLIMSYHPIIFRPLKSLTLENSQQRSLLRLAAEGISVYCPHTAVDAAIGGNADWLSSKLINALTPASQVPEYSTMSQSVVLSARGHYELQPFPKTTLKLPFNDTLRSAYSECYVVPIVPSDNASNPNSSFLASWPKSREDYGPGMGRLVTFAATDPLANFLQKLTAGLGDPRSISVALPQGTNFIDHSQIRRVAVCAGSGGSILARSGQAYKHFRQRRAIPPVNGVDDEVTGELWVTGEMSHHEVLAATERGIVVVCLGHSNSERGYLNEVMVGCLQHELEKTWTGQFQIHVSESDRDPLQALVLG